MKITIKLIFNLLKSKAELHILDRILIKTFSEIKLIVIQIKLELNSKEAIREEGNQLFKAINLIILIKILMDSNKNKLIKRHMSRIKYQCRAYSTNKVC